MTDDCSFLDSSVCRHPTIGPAIVQLVDCAACIAFNGRESDELTQLAEYRERIQRGHKRESTRSTCRHRGTKLSVSPCCGQMYACNLHRGKKCAPVGVAKDPFLSCQTCDDWSRIADPFTDIPVIHFGAHLWPIRGHWEWHVDLWNEVAKNVNGRCVVGVATDANTATLKDVRDRLDSRFELFEFPNTEEGENHTFRQLQTMIPDGQNDVLIYCHGKGVRSHTASSEAVRVWTELMYETVVFNHARIIDRLSDGYKCFGSFRTYGDKPLSPVNRWHYSGTFFAVRAKHIAGRSVKNQYGGVEAWCGDHIDESESWCEFTDWPEIKIGYDIDALYPSVIDANMQWEADRLGGPRCEQHGRELEWFMDQLQPSDRVLVIGSKHGGLEHQLKLRYQGIETVSIDIAPQPDNVQPIIAGSSADSGIQEQAKDRGPYDLVFIDGDHSYEGVKQDWEFALSLQPRLIAFHDIADAVKHRREGCEVDKLWKEIKAAHRTTEKIVGCGWGGIGVVDMSFRKQGPS